MSIFTWENKYTVGVSKFDEQHQKLFNIINKLHDAMLQGKGDELLGNILTELLNYTKTHFVDEERMLEKYKYPQITRQKNEHMYFIKKIEGYKQDSASGKITISLQIMNFLRDWLVKHIQVTDKQYESFFQSLKVQQPVGNRYGSY